MGYKTMIVAMQEQRIAKLQARIEAMEKVGSANSEELNKLRKEIGEAYEVIQREEIAELYRFPGE
jgi:restriction endonuclease S subunit